MDSALAMSDTLQPKKFLFDLAFDSGTGMGAPEKEKAKPTYSEEQLEDAKKLAHEAGFSAGQKAMMEDQQQYTNVLLTEIDRKLSHLWDATLSERQRYLAQLQEIALVIARKIMPTYVERYGMMEIETIVSKIIAEMSREPRLVIRISESLFDDASAKINAISENQAYAGKVVILGDPELGASDCRIEWADGGIERDLKSLWADIDRVMEEVQSFESSMIQDAPAPSETPATASGPATASETGENA